MAGSKGRPRNINGDPCDSRLENVQVLPSQAERARLHGLKRGNNGH
jgi:hypothetical protein